MNVLKSNYNCKKLVQDLEIVLKRKIKIVETENLCQLKDISNDEKKIINDILIKNKKLRLSPLFYK